MLRRILTALAIPAMGLALAGAAATATPGNDGCCCIADDTGQLVCTLTGEVLETCFCE